MPLGQVGISAVDIRDIAEAAAIALTSGELSVSLCRWAIRFVDRGGSGHSFTKVASKESISSPTP